jgi:MerR family transcriptional regulator, light-induced transcriptional regulator
MTTDVFELQNFEKAGRYQIRDLAELSGIKAHTLRVWEQRYKLIKPKRTATNIRYYDNNDLKLMLNVALLCKNKIRISKISKMSAEEINKNVDNLIPVKGASVHLMNELIVAMMEMDERKFEDTLEATFTLAGFEDAMIKIVVPFLKKVGVLWQTNSIRPSHEHYAMHIIRQKIMAATNAIRPEAKHERQNLLMFLPESEMNDIGLLLANYMARVRHNHVTYLGMNVPLDDVAEINAKTNPDMLLSIFTTYPTTPEKVSEYLKELSETFSTKKILVTGYRVLSEEFVMPANIVLLKDYADLKTYLD